MDELFDGSNAHPLAACPKCGRKWMPPCEQTICIDAHGECIPCRFVPVGGEINKHGSGAGFTELTKGDPWYRSGQYCAAAKRASMDLSKALVAVRRGA